MKMIVFYNKKMFENEPILRGKFAYCSTQIYWQSSRDTKEHILEWSGWRKYIGIKDFDGDVSKNIAEEFEVQKYEEHTPNKEKCMKKIKKTPNILNDGIKAFLDDPQWPEHIKDPPLKQIKMKHSYWL